MRAPPRQVDFDREAVRRRGFKEFARRAWPRVEPMALRWGWHLDAVCEHLEAVARREVRDLVINIPPGCSKSLLASVLFPSWVWTLDPTHRWICASYSDKVVLRDARKCRSLVASDWYRARWPQVEIPRDATASTAVTDFHTTAGGMRYSTTVPRGQVTGQHCDTMLVDDPLDPQGAALLSGAELEAVVTWWRETMSTRFRDHQTSARVLVMQRLHERDLAAEMARAGATVLCLPMEHERAHPHRYPRDPRVEEGELLVPDRFPRSVVQSLKTALGPRATAAQLQQRPAPAGGGIFKLGWLLRYWTELPQGGSFSQSWDLTFKETTDGSLVSGQVWYDVGPDHYLVDRVAGRWSFAETLVQILALSARWPKAIKKRVEAKANGPAVASALKGKISGIELIEPEGGKVARANAVEPLFASGNVYFPHPERAVYPDGRRGAPWVPEVQGTFVSFPHGLTDDDVDAATQHLNAAAPSYAARLAAAMAKARQEQETTA